MRRIALACGIVGGVWALVAAFLMVITLPAGIVEGDWWILAVLMFVMLMSTLSLVAIAFRTRKLRLAAILTWVSIAAFLGLFTWRILVLPAAILLIPAAMGMRPTP